MKNLKEFREELQKFNQVIEGLKKEKIEKTIELQQKKKERQRVVIEQFGAVDGRSLKPYNQAIEQLEYELKKIEEQLELSDQVKMDKFAPKIRELKLERTQLIGENNKKIQELEKQLFEKKLSFMLELEKAGEQQRALQHEVDEYHSVISQFEQDSKTVLYQFQMYSLDYLIYGGSMRPPVSPTDREVHKIMLGANSPHRLPFSFLLFKLTDGKEVIMNESEAKERYEELLKGAYK